MISNYVSLGSGAFQIVAPMLEHFKDGQKFFVVNTVAKLSQGESLGMKCNRVKLAV